MATKLSFFFVGKTKERFIQMGIDEYLHRLRRYVSPEVRVVKAGKIGPKADTNKVIEAASRDILTRVSPAAYRIALDSTGKQLSSVDLARFLTDLERQGREEIIFITGGPLGLSPTLLKECHFILSLSKLTLTHEMCRLILFEQVYRAYTIKAGEKYHK